MADIYYHGANGDKILKIIQAGVLKPDGNKIFLARFEPQNCYTHGGDRQRKANYVIKVKVDIPDNVKRECLETPGVRDTLVLHTSDDIRAEVLELYVRKRNAEGDGFDFDRIVGTQAIILELNK